MLDYKDVIIKHYGLGMSGREIAKLLSISKSGVNDFLAAFKKCETLSFPLPEGITNYAIANHVYGPPQPSHGRDAGFALPDFEEIHKSMSTRKNMPLVYLWNRYAQRCREEGTQPYQYRQFCKWYSSWCAENKQTMHFTAVLVCDNCKQTVIANRDWIAPELNKDYAEWAEYNHTVILPAKVKKPKYKSSVENAVGILEKGIFHDLEDFEYLSLEQFNNDLWARLGKLNKASFKKKEYSRNHYWETEREALQLLPTAPYEYMERRTAKVSSDYHIRFDNAYYSVGREDLHKEVLVRASASTVKIYTKEGKLICQWPRATSKSQWSTDPSHRPPGLQGVFRMERHLFHQEGHDRGAEHRRSDSAYPYQSQV